MGDSKLHCTYFMLLRSLDCRSVIRYFSCAGSSAPFQITFVEGEKSWAFLFRLLLRVFIEYRTLRKINHSNSMILLIRTPLVLNRLAPVPFHHEEATCRSQKFSIQPPTFPRCSQCRFACSNNQSQSVDIKVETAKERFKRKFSSNPIVPIGKNFSIFLFFF